MRDDTASRRSAAEVAAGRIVEEFLDASMIPDPVRARTYMPARRTTCANAWR